ncbi:MAG TPA: MFS transporter [Candidatus Dormibacteraeota bacterium]|nr:MFS transporter [Candidatus Dormibacteraeota bacterium]
MNDEQLAGRDAEEARPSSGPGGPGAPTVEQHTVSDGTPHPSGTDTAALPDLGPRPAPVTVSIGADHPNAPAAVAGSDSVQPEETQGAPPGAASAPQPAGSDGVTVTVDPPAAVDAPAATVSATRAAGPAPPLHAARPALPTNPGEAVGFLAVLRRRDFRMLWGAQAASQLADKFLMFSLIVVVYNLTKASSTESLLMIAYTLPSVVLSAPAGVWADRHDKRTLMLLTNVVRAGLVLLIPLSQIVPGIHGQVWPLIVVTLLFSAVGQVFAPAEAASIPFLVNRDQIMTATSLFMTTVIVTLVVGVPLGTLSIKLFGDMAPFWIGSGLFAVAALGIWRIATSLRAVQEGVAPQTDVLRELREGIGILGRSPALRIALGQLTLSLVVVFTVFVLGPAYMRNALGRAPDDTYLVLIPATLGMVVSAVVLGRATPRRMSRASTLLGALLLGGAALVALGVLPSVWRHADVRVLLTPTAVVLAGLFGCALGALLIPAFTVLQERTTEETRGRIFGGIFTVINAAVALPLLLAGGLSDAFGVGRTVAGLGALLLLGALFLRTRAWHRLGVLDEAVTGDAEVPEA